MNGNVAVDSAVTSVQTLVELFNRMGLAWRLLPATVATMPTSTTNVAVLMDGDEQPSRAQSLVGFVAPGQRVMVMSVPPQGTYIIGFLGQNAEQLFSAGIANLNASIGADTTASAGYGQLGGSSVETPFTKYFDATRVRIDMSVSAFSTVATTMMRTGLQLVGGANPITEMTNYFFNAANDHRQTSGHSMGLSIAAGTYTCRPVWLRVSGTGTLTTDANDYVSYTVEEVW